MTVSLFFLELHFANSLRMALDRRVEHSFTGRALNGHWPSRRMSPELAANGIGKAARETRLTEVSVDACLTVYRVRGTRDKRPSGATVSVLAKTNKNEWDWRTCPSVPFRLDGNNRCRMEKRFLCDPPGLNRLPKRYRPCRTAVLAALPGTAIQGPTRKPWYTRRVHWRRRPSHPWPKRIVRQTANTAFRQRRRRPR